MNSTFGSGSAMPMSLSDCCSKPDSFLSGLSISIGEYRSGVAHSGSAQVKSHWGHTLSATAHDEVGLVLLGVLFRSQLSQYVTVCHTTVRVTRVPTFFQLLTHILFPWKRNHFHAFFLCFSFSFLHYTTQLPYCCKKQKLRPSAKK
jgi:hypothetical protein